MAAKNKSKKHVASKKYFSVDQANAMLPLVRAIVSDIADLARDLRERHDRLLRVSKSKRGTLGDAYQEELLQMQAEFEREQERMREFERELVKLGIELKDYNVGLIDFPCWMNDHEVYLCWRLGEPEVNHWHELNEGFSGRQKVMADATKN